MCHLCEFFSIVLFLLWDWIQLQGWVAYDCWEAKFLIVWRPSAIYPCKPNSIWTKGRIYSQLEDQFIAWFVIFLEVRILVWCLSLEVESLILAGWDNPNWRPKWLNLSRAIWWSNLLIKGLSYLLEGCITWQLWGSSCTWFGRLSWRLGSSILWEVEFIIWEEDLHQNPRPSSYISWWLSYISREARSYCLEAEINKYRRIKTVY